MSLKEVTMPNGVKDIDEAVRGGATIPEAIPVIDGMQPENAIPTSSGLSGWLPLESLEFSPLRVASLDYDILPSSLVEWVKDSAYRLDDSPPDYIAAGAMVSLGSLIGRRLGIQPKRNDDWLVVPNLWGGIIAPPSKRKSTQQTEGTRFLSALDSVSRETFERQLAEWETDNQVSEMVLKATKESAMQKLKKGSIDSEAVKRLIEEARQGATEEPVRQRFIFNDSTIEKVSEIEAENPMGLLLYRDELSGWLTSLERPERSGDRSFYLEGWNGTGSFSTDRIGRGSLFIPSHTISVYGGIQPRKLEPYLRSMVEGHGDDGFLQRFQVLVYPDTTQSTMVDKAPDLEARQKAENVYEAIAQIPAHDGRNIPALRFSADAQDTFDWWYKDLLKRIDSESSPFLQAHLGKYFSLMPSLALIIELSDSGYSEGLEVGDWAASKAAKWCDYLEHHARKIYGVIEDPLAGARLLARRLHKLPNPFCARDLSQKGWSKLNTAAEQKNALIKLRDHNYLQEVVIHSGGRPGTEYHINPAAIEDA